MAHAARCRWHASERPMRSRPRVGHAVGCGRDAPLADGVRADEAMANPKKKTGKRNLETSDDEKVPPPARAARLDECSCPAPRAVTTTNMLLIICNN